LIRAPRTECALSAVSITEIAVKNSIGKLEASSEAVREMIIAVALTEGLPLIGRDARFPSYAAQGLNVIWK
jgi:PIN domain nuclease of toxin-antitoxin system